MVIAKTVSNGSFDGENGHRYNCVNYIDSDGNPAGGCVSGVGFSVNWQAGPLQGKPANGAFVEDLITADIQRLEFYQEAGEGRFACAENEVAINLLKSARYVLQGRTKRRRAQGVEGTNAPHDSEVGI